jgi:hypothetical protein
VTRPDPTRRIRVTNCTAAKDEGARASGEPVTPDVLYVDPRIQRFFAEARADGVPWAVLSDQWGLLHEDDTAAWYERHPDTVSPDDEAELVRSVEAGLAGYDVIELVPLKATPHPLYERVLRAADTGATIVVVPLADD